MKRVSWKSGTLDSSLVLLPTLYNLRQRSSLYVFIDKNIPATFQWAQSASIISIAVWSNKMLFKCILIWEGMSFSLSYNVLIIGDSII